MINTSHQIFPFLKKYHKDLLLFPAVPPLIQLTSKISSRKQAFEICIVYE